MFFLFSRFYHTDTMVSELQQRRYFNGSIIGKGREREFFHNVLSFLFQAEVEETLKRIGSHKGVQGIVVVNKEGIRRSFPSFPTALI